MKNLLLLAFWLCYALNPTKLFAQDEKNEPFKDTLMIIPNENIKILVTGSNLLKLSNYNSLDSLKTLLLSDLDKTEKEIIEGSRTIHYFVHPSGKRRLKAENSDFPEGEINIEKEKALLNLDVPSFAYIIHDLSNDYDCYIYTKSPADIQSLKMINLNEAIKNSRTENYDLKRNSRIDIAYENNQWSLKNKFRKQNDLIEISPTFGMALFGNKWSPTAGIEVALRFTNKYGVQRYKVAGSVNGYTFTQFHEKELKDLEAVVSYDLRLMTNLNQKNSGRARWFGIEGGYLTQNNHGTLNDTYKIGICSEGFSMFNLSFDLMITNPHKTFYGMSLRLPF